MLITLDEHLEGEGTLTSRSVPDDKFEVSYSIDAMTAIDGLIFDPNSQSTPRLRSQFHEVKDIASKDGRNIADGEYELLERAIVVSKQIRLTKKQGKWKVVPPVLTISHAPRDTD